MASEMGWSGDRFDVPQDSKEEDEDEDEAKEVSYAYIRT